MGIVAALLKSPEQLHRLRAAIRGRYLVTPCDGWDAVRRLCDTEPVSLAVLDLYANGSMDLDPVRQLRRLYPRLVTIAYVAVRTDRVRDVFDAGRAGLDGLIIADRDDAPADLWTLLEQAESRSVASNLRNALATFDPTVRDAVLVAVTRAHENLSGDDLAELLSIPRRSLTKRLTHAGFPAPPRLLTWGREAQAFLSMSRYDFQRQFPHHADSAQRLQEAAAYAETTFPDASDRRRFIEQTRRRLAERIAEGRADAVARTKDKEQPSPPKTR